MKSAVRAIYTHPQRLAAAGVLLCCIALLPGCKAQQATDRQASAPVVAAGSGLACPAEAFGAFFDAFAASETVQRAFVRSPLRATTYDPQNLEGEPVVAMLTTSEISFPVIPSREEMERQGVVVEIEEKDGAYDVYAHSKNSGEYSKTFNFEKTNGCWQLAGTIDAAM